MSNLENLEKHKANIKTEGFYDFLFGLFTLQAAADPDRKGQYVFKNILRQAQGFKIALGDINILRIILGAKKELEPKPIVRPAGTSAKKSRLLDTNKKATLKAVNQDCDDCGKGEGLKLSETVHVTQVKAFFAGKSNIITMNRMHAHIKAQGYEIPEGKEKDIDFMADFILGKDGKEKKSKADHVVDINKKLIEDAHNEVQDQFMEAHDHLEANGLTDQLESPELETLMQQAEQEMNEDDNLEVPPPTFYDPDDLTKIEGIGKGIAKVLNEAGILTFLNLSKQAEEDIKQILVSAGKRYARHNPQTWSRQAELAAKGEWDLLHEWQQELDGGKIRK